MICHKKYTNERKYILIVNDKIEKWQKDYNTESNDSNNSSIYEKRILFPVQPRMLLKKNLPATTQNPMAKHNCNYIIALLNFDIIHFYICTPITVKIIQIMYCLIDQYNLS